MSEPIRAALEAAAEATCPTARTAHGPCAPLCVHCPRIAAKAIAAFLRALPIVLDREFHLPNSWAGHPYPNFKALADAVLAAAKEERE